jgi:hypothetical protein
MSELTLTLSQFHQAKYIGSNVAGVNNRIKLHPSKLSVILAADVYFSYKIKAY